MSPQSGGGLSFGARIAKPLRGGGGADSSNANGSANNSVLSNLVGNEGNKRTSWFFNTNR